MVNQDLVDTLGAPAANSNSKELSPAEDSKFAPLLLFSSSRATDTHCFTTEALQGLLVFILNYFCLNPNLAIVDWDPASCFSYFARADADL